MREIKFRAYHKERKTMVHFDIKTITKTPYPGFYYTEDLDGFYCELDDPNLYTDLMQFTGLLDRQGIEIYEGDIVCLVSYGDKCEVKWFNGGFYLFGEKMLHLPWALLRKFEADRTEVIGNIYENKELLNEAK